MGKKIVWVSANRFGHALLQEALRFNRVHIEAILTLHQDATTVMYDGVDPRMWYETGKTVYKIMDINAEGELLRRLAPDLVVVCGWRQKIDPELLTVPPLGVIGFHPTLLPKGRGPAPIINSILSGVLESGVTMFYMDEGLDSGDIISQEKFCIEDNDHAGDVYEKVIQSGRALVRQYLVSVADGTAPRRPQDEQQATYFTKPSLNNNRINFEEESLEEIFRKIKALSRPYNGAYIEEGNKRMTIWKAQWQDRN